MRYAWLRHIRPGLAGVLLAVLGIGTSADRAFAQRRPASPDSGIIMRAQCLALLIPLVRDAVARGNAPVLRVADQDLGPIVVPHLCPDSTSLLRNAPQIRVIRAPAARDMYGERGKNGVVVMDGVFAPPDTADRQDGRRRPRD